MHILTGDDKFAHDHLSTIIEMQEFLLEVYKVYTPRYLIAQAWEKHSSRFAAGFLHFDLNDSGDVINLLSELGLDYLHEIVQLVEETRDQIEE